MELKKIAKEIAESIGSDGMILYVLEDGEYGITTQNAGYWPVPKVWEINLSEWYWRDGLADAGFTEEDIDNPSEELIDYILDELKYVDWDSLINDK